jgi:hypothetical protein
MRVSRRAVGGDVPKPLQEGNLGFGGEIAAVEGVRQAEFLASLPDRGAKGNEMEVGGAIQVLLDPATREGETPNFRARGLVKADEGMGT